MKRTSVFVFIVSPEAAAEYANGMGLYCGHIHAPMTANIGHVCVEAPIEFDSVRRGCQKGDCNQSN